jgi:ER-bound oxygenase mpaB/B'/Rubber oxygenase, catalytic domain
MSDRRGAEAETLDSHQPFPAREYELPAGQKSPDLIRAERTVWRLAHIHFAWDINKALEFALLESFAVPSISGLLERNGEFKNRTLKRYDDTAILVREVMSNGLDSGRARRAFTRINDMHGRFRIANDDFLYVLSTFVFSPIDWLERFGRRGMTREEKEAWFFYWREFGRRMGIVGLPEDLAAFRNFAKEFEKTHFAPAPSNRAVAQATIDLLLHQYFVPPFLYPAGRSFVMALCSPHLVEALGYPAPSSALRLLAESVMGLRRTILRRLPEGTRPKYIPFGKETYPEGYTIEDLGCVQA